VPAHNLPKVLQVGGGGEKLLEFTEILETFGTFSRQMEIMID
jgi:hypothetical protein